jgi:hypothetical protein
MTLARRFVASRSFVPALIVGATSLAILLVLNPWLLFDPSTPSGGDMGAHVYGPAYLRDVLLPSGRIGGWSNDWFAGFPLFYFYFPLPSLVIVFLDVFLPYGVAFKLVTVMGLLATPPAVYFMSRAFRFNRTVSAIAGSSAAVFVFMESFTIYGGNIASTLAGEFSYSWSFALGFVYLGLLARIVDGERDLIPRAVVVFALAALSHILTIIMLVVCSAILFARKRAVGPVVTTWVWAGMLAGFWAIPLLWRLPLSTDMAWTPLSRWEEIFPIELWLLIPFALVGLVWAVRRNRNVLPVAGLMLLPLLYYPLPNILPELLPSFFEDGRWKFWNGRMLPYWYFGVVYFAALAIGSLVSAWVRRLPEHSPRAVVRIVLAVVGALTVYQTTANDDLPGWVAVIVGVVFVGVIASTFAWSGPVKTASVVTATTSAVLALGALAGVTFVDGWARWNYSGYEGKETFGEYQAFMSSVEGLPDGRYQWEFNSELNQYGTTMSLMLIPYWVGQGHQSMEGLFFESSLTVPFHFLNQAEMSLAPSRPVPGLDYNTFDFDRGIPHLRLYGVDYYVSFTDEAEAKAVDDPRLTEVERSGPFTFFEIEDSELVDVAVFEPSVYDPPPDERESFGEVALDWYGAVGTLDRWLVAEGPDDWPRVSNADSVDAARPLDASGAVSNVEIGDDWLSFETEAIGVPHLVKVSYFPNWVAEGAEGPYRAAPSLMVVVPTSEHVELRFGRSWIEFVGFGATLVAIAGLVSFKVVPSVRQRFGGADQGEEPTVPETVTV